MTRFTRVFILQLFCLSAFSQEALKPLSANLSYVYKELGVKEITPQQNQQSGQYKPQSTSLSIPFLDDFSYCTKTKYPKASLWADSMVYVNSGFPIAPPSIGVATFDGLNQHGYPYNPGLLNLASSRPADTLTSLPINLYTTPNSHTLIPSDKVALTFYYQARGYGENPELTDSLILDLYKPIIKQWVPTWRKQGSNNVNFSDTAFYRTYIRIRDTAYFHDGFRFRFRNKATTAGDFDHWNLDYVYLNMNRDSIADTLYNDLTFAGVPTPFLKDYSAMPFQQYNSGEMSHKNSVLIKNNYNQQISFKYENKIYNKTGAMVYAYPGSNDNLGPFKSVGYCSFQPICNPAGDASFTYLFPNMTDSSDFTIKHVVDRGTTSSSDFILENDTVLQVHPFRNYYAYDDGSAEAGYFVTGVGGKIAIKIRVNVTDTLRAMRIYFDPVGMISTVSNTSSTSHFTMSIWADGGTSGPGARIQLDAAKLPIFYDTLYRAFPEYKLNQKVILSPGTYYLGFQQESPDGIAVGFDRNYDSHTNTYFDSGSGWTQSVFKGSLLIHPVFGGYVSPPVGINEYGKNETDLFLVYPNPSTEQFFIRGPQLQQATYHVYNTLGQELLNGMIENSDQAVNTGTLPSGIYFLSLKENGKTLQQQKIILQH